MIEEGLLGIRNRQGMIIKLLINSNKFYFKYLILAEVAKSLKMPLEIM